MGGTYPGGGATIGAAMTTGYIAGKHVADAAQAGAAPEGVVNTQVSAGG